MVLDDGTYDAFVVDVATGERAGGEVAEGEVAEGEVAGGDAHTTLDLTIIAGPAKGEVVSVTTATRLGDEVDLIGMPATLTVTDGRPSVRIDR